MILLRNIIKVFFIFLFFQTSYSFGAEKFIVKKINFKGLQRISYEVALSYLPFYINDVIDNDDIKNGIRALILSKKFDDVRISKKKDILIIFVKERPLISQVVFLGNEILKNNQIEMILTQNKIISGEIFSPVSILRVKKIFKNLLQNYGKYNAEIRFLKKKLKYNCVRLTFLFSEGNFIKIKNFRIFGNRAFKKNEILSNFYCYKNCQFFRKNRNFPFQKFIFLDDLKRLEYFYFCRGYIKFFIKSINVRSEKSDIFIDINIKEGPKYKFSKIEIFGNATHYIKKVQNICDTYCGKIYNIENVSKIEKNIRNILNDNGYINPFIDVNQSIDETNKVINLFYNVNIGNRYYVRYIYFVGNSLTEDIVLRKEIQQVEGTILKVKLLEKSKIRLLSHLTCLERVDYQVNYVNGFTNQVDIVFMVKEKNSGNINVGAGFGNESGIGFQCDIQQDNLLGTGNSVSIHSLKNKLQSYYEIFIRCPNVKKHSIDFFSKFFFDSIKSKKYHYSPYDIENYGMSTYLGFPIGESNVLNIGIDFSHNNIFQIKPQIPILQYINSIKKSLKSKTKYYLENNIHLNIDDVLLFIEWQYNSLRNQNFPISGTYINLINKCTIPGFSNLYNKISCDLHQYVPIDKNKNWIFMERVYLGYACGLKKRDVPFYDYFYSNGINNIRGFCPNTIGPKAIYYKHFDKNYSDNYFLTETSKSSVGGNAMVIFNTELIVPTFMLRKEYQDKIRPSLFLDIGTVWNTKKNLFLKFHENFLDYGRLNFRVSSGFTIKWYSPVGPLSFSYSKCVKKYKGDRIEPFQFSFGKIW